MALSKGLHMNIVAGIIASKRKTSFPLGMTYSKHKTDVTPIKKPIINSLLDFIPNGYLILKNLNTTLYN